MVTDVVYREGSLDEKGKSVGYLEFTVKFLDENISGPNDRFLISYAEPYSYTRLTMLLTQADREYPPTHPILAYRRISLGKSLCGVDIPMLTFKKLDQGIVRSIYAQHKSIIFIAARAHPAETPGSFVCEGLIKELLHNTTFLGEFLTLADIYVVPMMNPDGVIAGNSRVSMSGIDLNRRWSASCLNPLLTPEISYIKEKIKKLDGRVEVFIDLHGHNKKEGAFFYTCSPNIIPS